jgi:hypothetical protein
MDNKKYKVELCKYYNSPKGCDKGIKCPFAHGEDDIKNNCLSGINCWNENCIYNHPEGWNPENNKKECLICYKYENICNKENPKYKHINPHILMNEDFPEIIKNKSPNNLNKEITFKYSDVLNNNNNNISKKYKEELLNEEDNMVNIKKQITNNYMLLKELDPSDWANYDEIDNIKKDINILEEKIHKFKQENKNDIFEDNLNLDFIFTEDNNEHEKPLKEDIIPDISISINIYETNDKTENINKLKHLIEKFEEDFELHNKEIKQKINNIIQNDYFKFILINNLNEISSKINLFKNNYEDITI